MTGPETDPLSLSIMQFMSGIILQMSQADMAPASLARLQVRFLGFGQLVPYVSAVAQNIMIVLVGFGRGEMSLATCSQEHNADVKKAL